MHIGEHGPGMLRRKERPGRLGAAIYRKLSICDGFKRTKNAPLDTNTLITQTLLVEHVIGLIKNKNLESGGNHSTFLDQIHNGTRGTNDHRGFQFRGAAVGVCRNGRTDNKPLKELSHNLNNTDDLTSQFTSRGQDQGLRRLLHLLRGQVETAEDIQHEGGGLSGTRLRLSDQVLRGVVQKQREGSLLNLRWFAEVHRGQTLKDVFISVEKQAVSPVQSYARISKAFTHSPRSEKFFTE